jgi:ElaB/YqjD/DUF883 family membrane-anchored ribosome-binding protein
LQGIQPLSLAFSVHCVNSCAMDVSQVLKDSANAIQAARLVTQTTADVVRQVPYAALGAAVLVGVLTGMLLKRRQRA